MPQVMTFVFLGLVVLLSQRYWISAMVQHPGEPLSVLAITKAGDIEYYPMIAALAHLRLGEQVVYEHVGSGLSSFPVWSMAPHAIAVALFGTPGFIVADVFVYLAFYACLLALFKAARIGSPWRECLALFLIAGGNEIEFWVFRQMLPSVWRFVNQWDLTFWLWGERIPRPFVSELYLVIVLFAFLRLVRSKRAMSQTRNWALLGIGLAALLQGDLHGAIELSFLVAPVALYGLWRLGERRGRIVRGLAVLAGAGIACSALFLVQRLAEHPDVAGRLGIFPIGRLDPKFAEVYPLRRLAPVALALCASGAAVMFGSRRIDRPFKLRVLVLLAMANVLACFALPLSALILGQGVQVYHFVDRFMHIRAYSVIISAVWLIDGVYRLAVGKAGDASARPALAGRIADGVGRRVGRGLGRLRHRGAEFLDRSLGDGRAFPHRAARRAAAHARRNL